MNEKHVFPRTRTAEDTKKLILTISYCRLFLSPNMSRISVCSLEWRIDKFAEQKRIPYGNEPVPWWSHLRRFQNFSTTLFKSLSFIQILVVKKSYQFPASAGLHAIDVIRHTCPPTSWHFINSHSPTTKRCLTKFPLASPSSTTTTDNYVFDMIEQPLVNLWRPHTYFTPQFGTIFTLLQQTLWSMLLVCK